MLFVAAAFPLVASCTQPRNTYQPAQVRLEAGRACFSVNDSDESQSAPPEIAAVTVQKRTPEGGQTAWVLDLTGVAPHVRLAPGDCVQYGTETLGGVHLTGPEPLAVGESYSVSINAFIKAPANSPDDWHNRRYNRDFCLQRDRASRLQVIIVPRRQGKPAWEICSAKPVEE